MWAEEMKLNAEWKAMLDKQEADRTGQYARLRERIHKMQRAYESNAGAELEAKMKEEEAVREMWIKKEVRPTRDTPRALGLAPRASRLGPRASSLGPLASASRLGPRASGL